jgi:heme/copper-type cytochrome/quinol oxidase subunit 3
MKRYNYNNIIEPSIYPIMTTLALSSMFISISMYISSIKYSTILLLLSNIWTIINIILWKGEIIKEGTYQGKHTDEVNKGLLSGFLLFVFSELLIFLTLFIVYFYSTISPSIEICSIYPPLVIIPIKYYSVPLLNTALLLFGSVTVTAALYAIRANSYRNSIILILINTFLNTYFTYLQYI